MGNNGSGKGDEFLVLENFGIYENKICFMILFLLIYWKLVIIYFC